MKNPVIIANHVYKIENSVGKATSIYVKDNQLIIAKNFENYELSLKGNYQKENLNIALTAIKTVLPQIDEKIIKKAINEVCLAGYILDCNR